MTDSPRPAGSQAATQFRDLTLFAVAIHYRTVGGGARTEREQYVGESLSEVFATAVSVFRVKYPLVRIRKVTISLVEDR